MAGKILIIDDDRDITQIIRILLEGEGFETCTAYSGTRALASLDETVELIILDIMMDGMNGFEVCHRIRESSYVPILFLSAMSGDSEKVAALMAGELLEDILGHLGVEKTYTANADVLVPNLSGLNLADATSALQKNNLTLRTVGDVVKFVDSHTQNN